MKNLWISLALLLTACTGGKQAGVTVANPLATDRTHESVTIAWDSLTARIDALTADNVIVTNLNGDQIPSQVITGEGTTPLQLIFQADVPANDSVSYTVCKGIRSDYKQEAYGRFVPERKDDYAWENNLVAFRLYGPALEELMVSNGIDYWAKATPNLIIDPWYRRDLSGGASYHLDQGEGCDCYKVGQTVGMGASAPYAAGKLWYSRNFTKAQTLDNGPIRTTAKITYAAFDVSGEPVSLTKIISLDAFSHFNRITDLYTGAFDSLQVAAGVAVHDSALLFQGAGYIGLWEPASDSHAGTDGPLGGAIILPQGTPLQVGDVAACIATTRSGEALSYYAGAATSKQEIDAQAWQALVKRQQELIAHPLKVSLR